MKLIIFLICAHLVYSEFHTMITYTEISGKTTAGTPEFSAVTTLDDQQIDYYDGNTMELIPRKDWMKEFALKSKELWKDYSDIRQKLQQIYKLNITVLMQLNQSHGLRSYQRVYGCDWDNETKDSHGFDRHNYDGQDFISLDLKKFTYITPVKQAEPIVQKWNNDRTELELLKQYFGRGCFYWLNKFLRLSKATIEKADPPKVSLLQKNPDSPVECHVTGFLFRNTIISWRKNGQAMSDKLESRDTLPNEDGTFQRTVALYVHPDEWMKDQYTCVVEHKSLTESIQKILTEDEIKRNRPGLYVPVIKAVVVLIVLFVIWKCRN
ncbi:major histocompatibility complex class I-related gene protein-like isoform X2 [Ctenopharyngodon idella]|uniref:major histocompatibility complex class I-related gene protein-like isoform X2 n=1 Tax=Ctenopharyngodon idella TaxID=7959 RepID=UPI002231E5C1|nr:major histocompatibility complex class I-related gene protein-like isoform X2 [Ctenopharyngodon idella]XP_051766707.1 major histocompatibility complex class I-related gene protein-like isoform X2 [Ctenopharyngodon idella]